MIIQNRLAANKPQATDDDDSKGQLGQGATEMDNVHLGQSSD